MITAKDIKTLRETTGAGIMEVKKALEEAKGNQVKAAQLIRKWGLVKADSRQDKATAEGLVYSYVHPGGRVGAMVLVNCETDFVAKSQEFIDLARELSLQVVSMNPKSVKELLSQDYIRDPKRKISDLVAETAAKVKEKIVVADLVRFSL